MSALPPLIKPPALKPGATIGVIAPSKWSPPDDLAADKAVLEAAGYQVVIGDTNKVLETPFAGTPQQRADKLHHYIALSVTQSNSISVPISSVSALY
ncbi:MAG: LD-carboxypeptidase [Candidatus Marinimicrobia bacterium]|nr:LD-carboxypeptidase [Candidatus Neomarinimicrobiota bacterium]